MGKNVKAASAALAQNNAARERKRRAVNQRTVKRRRLNKATFGHLTELAAEANITFPSKTTEVMMEELRQRIYALWRYAAKQADALHPDDFWVQKIDAQGNILVEPHKWIQYESMCRAELEEMGLKLIGLGLEERRVRIEEAEAMVVISFLDQILDRLNLTEAQRNALPEAIDEALPILEGQVVEEERSAA
jgi:hypothetical protein